MSAPQAVYVSLAALGIFGAAFLHGQDLPEPARRFNVVATCIRTALLTALLYWGGFFS